MRVFQVPCSFLLGCAVLSSCVSVAVTASPHLKDTVMMVSEHHLRNLQDENSNARNATTHSSIQETEVLFMAEWSTYAWGECNLTEPAVTIACSNGGSIGYINSTIDPATCTTLSDRLICKTSLERQKVESLYFTCSSSKSVSARASTDESSSIATVSMPEESATCPPQGDKATGYTWSRMTSLSLVCDTQRFAGFCNSNTQVTDDQCWQHHGCSIDSTCILQPIMGESVVTVLSSDCADPYPNGELPATTTLPATNPISNSDGSSSDTSTTDGSSSSSSTTTTTQTSSTRTPFSAQHWMLVIVVGSGWSLVHL
jgi:hypothetical protein